MTARRRPVITIDGPAGAGKSTVARLVAERLGLRYLDTGAMYRAMTWKALREKIPLTDETRIVEMIRRTDFRMDGLNVIVDGQSVSDEIRTAELTRSVAPLARSARVRQELVRLQQEIGRSGGLVTEGRDQGTVVFPDAELKIYLDASLEERARRRQREIAGDLDRIRSDITDRDRRDMLREVGPLKKPSDALFLDTTLLTIEEVVTKILAAIGPA